MKEISIIASVSGSIEQHLVLNFDIDKQEFLNGLNSGKYVTPISHGDGNGYVIEIDPFRIIGKVVAQSANDDLEIFEIEESK